ncbi:MAG: FABP family protein [Actinobacteria bacterium]|uniref:Peroxynitrite isomerase n=1 Tax=Nostocoides veronense TaxID=330836 RepID=A0ABP4Y4D5_9MICO|nr:FABP family protein [Actinomycetota bacterium]
MFHLDETIHEDIRPLAWLIGRWEGAGVVGYPSMESRNFGQEIVVEHDGRPFLRWQTRSWLLHEDGTIDRPASTEMGFWRMAGGEAELLLTHPTGILELYYGTAEPAKIELRTDGVLRSAHAKEYNAASRLYGLVNSNLMWAMDMAATGHPMQSHASAELKRVE